MANNIKTPFIDKIIVSVEETINFSTFSKVCVGFSGGADSTALLVVLNALSQEYKFKLVAVHFEHGLRGKASLKDAKWCRGFCEKYGIEYLEFSLDVSNSLKSGEGIEACARRLRLEKWKELVNNQKDAVALGHHKDDKVENLIIRLLRGSNVSGLTSLRSVSELQGVKILRPLLNLTKEDIEKFLGQYGIKDWRTDFTNKENRYRRNIVRNKILAKLYKLIPASQKGIIQAAKALEDDAQCLEQMAADTYKKAFEKAPDSKGLFPVAALQKMHPAIRARVLRYWLTDLLGFDFIPNYDLLMRIDSELKAGGQERKLIPLSNKLFLLIEKGCLSIYSEQGKSGLKPVKWNWKENPKIQFGDYFIEAKIIKKDLKDVKDLKDEKDAASFDVSKIPEELHVWAWERGDRFTPFGSDNSVKVKRIFKDQKVSLDDRSKIPLLCLPDNTIIWIAGLRRSNYAIVEKPATEVVVFTTKMLNRETAKL